MYDNDKTQLMRNKKRNKRLLILFDVRFFSCFKLQILLLDMCRLSTVFLLYIYIHKKYRLKHIISMNCSYRTNQAHTIVVVAVAVEQMIVVEIISMRIDLVV